jgi:hypothetical protein
MLSAHGVTHGIGDIHQRLYAAASTTGSFRDVVTGSNGTYSAGSGYDMVTGLGAPLWPALAPSLLTSVTRSKPTMKAQLTLTHPHTSSWRTVKLTWSGTKATGADVTLTKNGATAVLTETGAAPSGSTTFTGSPGSTYKVRVTTTNEVGSTSTTATIVVPVDNRSAGFRGRWKRHNSTHAIGGNYRVSTKRAKAAKVRLAGRRYVLVYRVAPKYGKAVILVNGHRVRTVQMHAKRAGFRSITLWGSAAKPIATRTVTVRPAGKKAVAVDAFYAYR